MVRAVQTARARAGEVLAGAPLDDGDVDPRQRQLARQHQPCRTSSGDHHRMLGHTHFVPPFFARSSRGIFALTATGTLGDVAPNAGSERHQWVLTKTHRIL